MKGLHAGSKDLGIGACNPQSSVVITACGVLDGAAYAERVGDAGGCGQGRLGRSACGKSRSRTRSYR